MALRTFLALEIDDTARDALADAMRRMEAGDAKVKWVKRDNLHVTMNFLGDVADDVIAQVCEVAAGVAGGVEPFGFDVRGAVCVPPRGRQVRMIWAGVAEPTGALASIYDKLADGFGALGFRREKRPFKPHVTLARVKSARDADALRRSVEQFRETDFGPQHAAELVIFSSQLTPAGPIYTPTARAPLG